MTIKNNHLKQKILNFFISHGQKKICENTLLKTFKVIQKINKNLHSDIVKLSILNTTPIFRIIRLKKKKKKGADAFKEIPAFLSNNYFRACRSIKTLVEYSRKKKKDYFYAQLKNEILLHSKNESDLIKLKNDLQEQASKKKFFFRHYRW